MDILKEEGIHTEKENHFDIPWKLEILRDNDFLSIYLDCVKLNCEDHWEVKTETTVQVLSKNGDSQTMKKICQFGNAVGKEFGESWPEFMSWRTLEDNFAIHGEVTIQVNVRILEMVGFRKENLKVFDESVKEFSDIVLVVGDRKFYTSKLVNFLFLLENR